MVKTLRVQLNYQNEPPKLGEGQQVNEENLSDLGYDKDNLNNFATAKQINVFID